MHDIGEKHTSLLPKHRRWRVETSTEVLLGGFKYKYKPLIPGSTAEKMRCLGSIIEKSKENPHEKGAYS